VQLLLAISKSMDLLSVTFAGTPGCSASQLGQKKARARGIIFRGTRLSESPQRLWPPDAQRSRLKSFVSANGRWRVSRAAARPGTELPAMSGRSKYQHSAACQQAAADHSQDAACSAAADLPPSVKRSVFVFQDRGALRRGWDRRQARVTPLSGTISPYCKLQSTNKAGPD